MALVLRDAGPLVDDLGSACPARALMSAMRIAPPGGVNLTSIVHDVREHLKE